MGVSRRSYAWDQIVALARRKAGEWCQHRDLLDAPTRTVARIRGRNHPALHVDGGHWEVRVTNEYEDEYGDE